MSVERVNVEARRWLAQAQSDIAAAKSSAASSHYEWACFQAQQSAEKAMKACWFSLDLDPWGHSVAKLVDGLPGNLVGQAFLPAREPARQLDKLYIPTRYPNGLPEMTPSEAFSAGDAEAAISADEQIHALAGLFIGIKRSN